MALARLESEGIRAQINTRIPLYGLKTRKALLSVHKSQLAEAVAILRQTPARLRLIVLDSES